MMIRPPLAIVALLTITLSLTDGLLAAPFISEFLASNSEGLADEDGEASDWIEIHVPHGASLSLAGYTLTDDQENLTQWAFPDVTVEGGGYLIVFASGKDRSDPEQELHANFRLDNAGEYLALVAPDGTPVSEFTFPEQHGDVSYGLFEGEPRFFKAPTPGEANGDGLLGFVADTTFSIDRGFYDEPFELVISTETEGAEIRYTIDGSDPAKATLFNPAKKYTEPLQITTTTVVRAMATKPGWERTNTDTQTYIFLDDVVEQPDRPEGFPERWGSFSVDYGMDPDITGPNADKMRESLTSLPTVSFVGNVDDFFGSSGIYANPEARGEEWERPISFEWLNRDGSSKFQVDCGARIQGGYFRQASATEKHSFRLLFKSEYGPGKLREDIIDVPGAAEEFDTIVFRAGANDGYAWDAAGTTVQFTRDEFGRRLAWDAGHPSPVGGFVHLYVNGLYWGLYNLAQRPNEDFSSTYYGGEPEEWDSINSGEIKSGSLSAWNDFISLTRTAESLADYRRLQGLNADGTRNADFPVYLDESHYADYMIINLWGGNWDWPNKNFWFGRHNSPESTGFKFYVWDFENTMGNNRDRSPLNMNAPRNTEWVGQPWANLRDLVWFQIAYADRVQKHFFNDGILTKDSLKARYQALADSIEPAIYAETARWGDDNRSQPHTIEEWRAERDWMLETYLEQRSAIVRDQFIDKSLFPQTAAPVLEQHGGPVRVGETIRFTSSASNLYYTTDGSDPFVFDPDTGAIAVSDQAMAYAGPFEIDASTTVKARYYSKSLFGAVNWSALTETVFVVGSDDLRITEIMYHPTPPTEDEIAAGFTASSQFEYIVVTNTGSGVADLNGVRFTNGIDFDFSTGAYATLASGDFVVVVRDLAAFETRYGTGLPVAGVYEGRLDDAGERVTLTGPAGETIMTIRYDDAEPWPVAADGGGASLVLHAPATETDYTRVDNWREGVPLAGDAGNGEPTPFEAWLTAHGLESATGDPDGDGWINYFEYLLASDAKKAVEERHYAAQTMMLMVDGQENRYLTVRFSQRSGLDTGVIRIEQSTNLLDWEDVSGSFVEHERSALGPDRELRLLRASSPLPEATSAVYLRLRTTLPMVEGRAPALP